jgi:DNA invertase Pin-like site-specific DNA recombinase
MIFGYIRVSTDKQTTENQRFEILKFSKGREMIIEEWIEETISAMKKLDDRKFGALLKRMKKGDILIVTELSRLGRNLMQIMSILHHCMEKDIMVFTIKEHYELGNNINSKVLAFAFGLSAEIERNLISQRTKEALARRRSEGVILGRPIGSKSKITKLTNKEEEIRQLLQKKVSYSAIGRILGVHRFTVSEFVKLKKLTCLEKI